MKIKICILLSALLLSVSCNQDKEVYLFTSFREPATEGLFLLYSYDGYNWHRIDSVLLKPEVGKQKVMRDPSIVKGPDGIFHLVWTSSWQGDRGFGYTSSKDLLNWSEQQFIPVMDFDTSTVNVWAPELFYDAKGNQFVIIWASTIPYKFDKGIEEEQNNHRLYYTVTKDFRSFSETKLFLDPGFSVIDAVIVEKKEKDYVLILKDNTRPNRNLKVAFGSSPLGPYSDISETFTEFLTEGPTAVKIEEDWLIYFDVYWNKTFSAVKTKDFKTFENISDSVSIPNGHKHGTIFKAKKSILRNLLSGIESEGQGNK